MPWCPSCRLPVREDKKDSFELGIQGGSRVAPPGSPDRIPSFMTTWWPCLDCLTAVGAPWEALRASGRAEPISTFVNAEACTLCKGGFREDREDAFEVTLRGPCTKPYQGYAVLPGYPAPMVPAWDSFSSICAGCLAKVPEMWRSLFRPMEMGKDFTIVGPLPYKM